MSIFIKKTMRRLYMPLTVIAALAAGSSTSFAQEPPASGKSPRIDAIKSAGVLRVAVLSNAPWLIENTSGTGEAWDGPAWILAKEYARLLGVKLQTVPVSHETKVPVLASNQADLSITALAETPERLKVVDFVIYSQIQRGKKSRRSQQSRHYHCLSDRQCRRELGEVPFPVG